ncbi:MAG: amino acid permease [Gemmataceae bacterium]|nr:amino acid permease [Gemmataceae bacterium]
MDTPAQEPRPLQVRLGLWDTASILIGIIIGVGIFTAPATVFSYSSGPWAALAIWGLGGLISLVGAFCFAELASTYPRSGGEYVYLTRAYGAPAGFLFAWAQLAIIRTGGSIAMVAYIFAQYAAELWDVGTGGKVLLATLAIALLSLVNVVGVRLGKGTQNFLTIAKVAGLGVILLAGFFWARTSAPLVVVGEGELVASESNYVILRDPNGNLVEQMVAPGARVTMNGSETRDNGSKWRVENLKPGVTVKALVDPAAPEAGSVRVKASDKTWLGALALALIFVLWTYSGWHEGAYVAAEVENRRRNLPRALLLGTGIVTALYLLVNAAYAVGLGHEAAGDTQRVAADVLGLTPWGEGRQAMALLVVVSALGAINGMIFTSSRIYAELGADHRLFAPLAHWSRRWGTPVRSLVAQAAISIAMVAVVGLWFHGQNGFEVLLKCTSPVFCLFFLLTGVSLIVLRSKDRHLERPFVTPAYPLLPLVFCAFWGFMLVGSVLYAPREAAVGLGVLLLGVPLYVLSRGWKPVKPPEPCGLVVTSIRDEGRHFIQPVP